MGDREGILDVMLEQSPTLSEHAPRGRAALIALILICAAVEMVLQLGDLGLVGGARLRQAAYEYGGFWSGLLGDWSPNYAVQPYAMFLTYAFLHGGLLHLIVNMATLWSLGVPTLDRAGTYGFWLIYAGSAVFGALAFGLLSNSPAPMVGASGALFGLAGAVLAWNYVDRLSVHAQLWPVVRAVLLLLAMNLAMWWALDGMLAWETHLGGFVGGWLLAMLIAPVPRA